MMRLTYAVLFTVAVAVSGCASKGGLYNWGGYDAALYGAYSDPTTVAANMQKLEVHIQKLESGKQKVPPGLYADLGMMQLQAGDKGKAMANFQKEREVWPESAVLMDALINNGTTPKAKEAKS
jgi:hypothetical protein